jgi:hypothetical protein
MEHGVWGLLASAALLFSCSSGQTGSADCAPSKPSCVCEALAGKSLTRATLIALDETTATLEIQEVLNPNTLLGPADVQRHVVGAISSGPACEGSQRELPRIGDTVFAAFYPYSDAEPIAAYALVQPWSESVDIGNATLAPLSDAVALTDPETCDQRYPRYPTPPCNDTSGFGDCALSPRRPAPTSSAGWFAWLLIGVATLGLRRRR